MPPDSVNQASDEISDEKNSPPTARGRDLSDSQRLDFLGWLRLCLAVGFAGILPFCWLMIFATGMNIPLENPVWVFAVALIAVAILTPVLCLGLWGQGLLTTATRRWSVRVASLLIYLAIISGILFYYAGPVLPFWQVWLVLGTGSLWTYWLAWFLIWNRGWGVRLASTLILGGWGWGLFEVIRFDGLTGDAKANFAWKGSDGFEHPFPSRPSGGVGESRIPLSKPDPFDFPEFLGNRQGHLVSRPLLTDWEKTPPQEIWRKPVGLGWSSFALMGDLGITLEQRGMEEAVVCYRLSTGDEVWSHSDPVRFHGVLGGDGPRTTPTIDEDRVYAVGGTGLLNVLDLATGKKIWGIDLIADNGGKPIHHGLCGSPLIVDDYVVVSPSGGPGISLVAYDKRIGRRVWRSGKWEASYSSPMLATLKGVRQILVYNHRGVEAHGVERGELLWSYEWSNVESTICSQPVLVPDRDDQVLLSVGYGKGSLLLEVKVEPGGDWSASPLWSSLEMKSKFSTPVISNGFLYGLDDGILACIDLKTGRKKWKKGRYQYGQILLVGDWLLVQAEAGDLVLVKPDPSGLREVGRIAALNGKTWNNLALGKEYCVVRNDREAICFRIVPATSVVAVDKEAVPP